MLSAFLGTLPGAPAAIAAPQGEQVVQGQASFARDGNTTTITTGTRQTIIDYKSFDIGSQERVRIDQPDAGSRTLNRVLQGDATRVDGQLSSNGIVYILNPRGVFLGNHAVVDVGGLVAGAGQMSNADFLSGVDRFSDVQGDVGVAAGASVRAVNDIALIGRHVENYGQIVSERGLVAFVAGERVVLAPLDGHVSVHVDGPSDASAESDFALTQAGSVKGQRVVLAAGDTYSLAMNHTGVTRAQEIQVQAGPESRVQLAGTLDASNAAAGERGGKIRVQGGDIAVAGGAVLDASGAAGGGEILVGGDVRGGGDMPTAQKIEVAPGAILVADAREFGDGGKIVLYARERTAFLGSISARGGAAGGDGGFAEVSGATVVADGTVDLGAPAGHSGTLLYDPDEAVIVGGSVKPADTSTTSYFSQDQLQNTNASVVIEALNRIFTSGDFTGDAVVLLPGNSLTLRTTLATTPTTAPSSPLGIDLTRRDNPGDNLNANLAWVVSQGGNITIQTNLPVLSVDDASAPRASIRVGRLESNGAAYTQQPNISVQTPSVRTISVTAVRGDVEVGDIVANGDPSSAGRSTSAGANVSVASSQGDVSVQSIQARGGSAAAGAPSPGANGGAVDVRAVGTTRVAGDIDTSGGDGQGSITVNGVALTGAGGAGNITLVAAGDTGSLTVTGNLTARGGDVMPPVGSTADASLGGSGGSISLSADNRVDVGAAGARVVLDASGGDGPGSGGTAVGGSATEGAAAIAIAGSKVGTTPNDVEIHADLIARGGNARQFDSPSLQVSGGAGGRGGDVAISAGNGSVLGADMTIDASGGTGNYALDPTTGQIRLASGTPFFVGGGGGTVSVRAPGSVDAQRVVSLGGNGTNGLAGNGGSVTLASGDATTSAAGVDLRVGDVITSGGSSGSELAVPGVALPGGTGGSVTLQSQEMSTGNLFLRGSVGGIGGTGLDATGATTNAQGSSVQATAANAIELDAAAPPTAVLRGGNLALDAPTIGALAPIPIQGTAASADAAKASADESVAIDLKDNSGDRHLERVEVALRKADGTAVVTRNGGPVVLQVAPAVVSTSTPQTLQVLSNTDASDPRIAYRLDVTPATNESQPTLDIAPNALNIGSAGAEIINGGAADPSGVLATNRGAIAALSPGSLGVAKGDLHLEGSTLGTSGTPLAIAGYAGGAPQPNPADPGAVLSLDAQGDIHVDETSTSFGAIDITQRDVKAATTDALGNVVTPSEGNVVMNLVGTGGVSIVSEGTATLPVSRIALADTPGAFAYRVATGAVNTTLQVDEVKLGGAGLLSTPGDLVLSAAAPAAVSTRGYHLSLISEHGAIRQDSPADVELDFRGAGAGDATPGSLLFRADDSFGSHAAPIRTQALQGVAGTSSSGGIFLVNADAGPGEASDVRIERVENLSPSDLTASHVDSLTEAGLIAQNGDIELENADPDGRIVFGNLGDTNEFDSIHLDALGNVVLTGRMEIENARFHAVQGKDSNGNPETTYQRLNDARIRSFTGDIALNGSVDTSSASVATSSDPAFPPAEFVPGSLELGAGGTVRFGGDVGKRAVDAEHAPLALLDTTKASLAADRQFEVGQALFRGTLDGPGAASIYARDLHVASQSDADHDASVEFAGDVGGNQGVAGLDVTAEHIRFTSADRVIAGAGGVHLDTQQTTVPDKATISDTTGLRISTTGAFTTGALDKFTAVGPLTIQAASARFTDLSATGISVDSPQIQIVTRAPGPVLQRDGTTTMDSGTDVVADEMDFSSVPTIDNSVANLPDPVVKLGLGSGGISAPGKLSAFEVVRFTPNVNAVDRDRMVGTDGSILDLTPSGANVVGNPADSIPRPRPEPRPTLPPSMGHEAPAPPPPLGAEQVLAYLRCGSPEGVGAGCDAAETQALGSLRDFRDSALATPRAVDVAGLYRELRAHPLGPVFDAAGAGYRKAHGFGELDGRSFGAWLESAPDYGDARAALHRIATLLVEIDLLGLGSDDETRVRHEIASEVAAEVDLPGLDADGVLEAVAQTPIGLPPSRSASAL